LKTAAKPLQMDTWLLWTSYRKSPLHYLTVPLPALYDLLFTHNTARLAYHGVLLPFKIIQGLWFILHLKVSMWLPGNG